MQDMPQTDNLDARPVTIYDAAYSAIRNLYREAFPAKERYPLVLLRLAAWKPEIEFLAFYSADSLCGITFTIDVGRYLYLMYLAVGTTMRGCGVGTRILTYLKARYPGRDIVLEIEPVDPKASNYDQRLRRLAFYERNGFRKVGYDFFEGTVCYTVLATGTFDAEEFAAALRKVSHGLYRFKMLPTAQP